MSRLSPVLCWPLLALILLIAGCGGGTTTAITDQTQTPLPKPAPEARSAMSLNGGPGNTTDFIAGQFYDVGDVEVTNTGTELIVHITLSGSWVMTATHLYVGTTIPKSTAPGSFPYKALDLPLVTEYTYTVPLTWDCGSELYLAVHGNVQKQTPFGWLTHTAWGKGPIKFKKGWGWFMNYEIEPVCQLPADATSFRIRYPNSPTAFFRTRFFDVPPGLTIQNEVDYSGWCVDLFHNIPPPRLHTGRLWSTYDNALPAHLLDDDWDLVNYLLNNRQGAVEEVQEALWYFVGGGGYPYSTVAQEMVEDALANGEGFVPGPGEKIAIVVDPVQDIQITIIEAICDCS